MKIDQDGEFTSRQLCDFCDKSEIQQKTQLRTPQQIKIFEWKNRTLLECAKSLILENNVSNHLSSEVVSTTYILKHCPTHANVGMTLYEKSFGIKLDLSHMKKLSCSVQVHIAKEDRGIKVWIKFYIMHPCWLWHYFKSI